MILYKLNQGKRPVKPIFVLATTNRADAIDSALQRPGRFDRVVSLGLPNRSGRLSILMHHLKRYRMAPDLDLEKLLPDFWF